MPLRDPLLLYNGSGVTPCQLTEGSNLLMFFRNTYPLQFWVHETEGLTVEAIIKLLDKYIYENNLFEQTNCEIISCDADLQMALSRKAFHFTELFTLVQKDLQYYHPSYWAVPGSEETQFQRDRKQVWSSWKSGCYKMDRVCRLSQLCKRKLSGLSTLYVSDQLRLALRPLLGDLTGRRMECFVLEEALKRYIQGHTQNHLDGTIYLTQGTHLEQLTGARLVALQQAAPIVRAYSSKFNSALSGMNRSGL